MCNNCIHKPVCSKHIATGGVRECEHFKEEKHKTPVFEEDLSDGAWD